MDPSDKACIEVLRPKTIPEGLIALGTIVQISDIQLKIQITGGVVCLIDLYNVNRIYSNLLENAHKKQATCQNTGGKEVPKLNELFKVGQQYVCKIIEKRARKGYAEAQDIMATLDPTQIQEDQIPKTLLAIPQIPLQCVVQSIEDHGYQLDLGFKGLTGFLKFVDSDEKLVVGQVLRCCTKEAISQNEESRVINVTMVKSMMKKSKFSREKVNDFAITERCILPGTKSFLTVMKVVKNGLIVNFMNEFAGFVGPNHLQDEWHDATTNYKISDQFNCTVLYYNHITKTFALSIRKSSKHKKALKHIINNYYPGLFLKRAKVAYIQGTKFVAFQIDKSFKAIANVRDALNEDVATMTKDELLNALDSTFPEKSDHKCRVKSLNLADLIIVVSLKEDYMKLPFVSTEEIKPADFIDVTVKKYVKDGIVVSFGLNLRAIILNSDLEDYASQHSYKLYPVGKKIKCRVLKVDATKQPSRVYLTNKQQLMDPDLTIIDSIEKSVRGKSTSAKILIVKPNGLIVELFNNVKGFIPRRFLTTSAISKVEDIFKVGQIVSCTVYSVNPGRGSLNLGVIPIEKIMEAKKENKLKKELRREERKSNKLTKSDDNAQKKLVQAKKRPRVEESPVNSSSESENDSDDENEKPNDKMDALVPPPIKSRRLRSEEAKQREEVLREAERRLMDSNRTPQNIGDFERLIVEKPNSADVWINYSKFMIDNIETEKARIICRRALGRIQFREEKEKLKVWLHLIRIEAKFGGKEKLKETIKEAEQTNDKLRLYQGVARVLTSCDELEEAKNMHDLLLKNYGKLPIVWIDYILFHMQHRKDMDEARNLYQKACKVLVGSDLVNLKSRFAQFEFKFGDVERGKTLFESLLSDNPKRKDLWIVYKAMVQKYGTRQFESEEVQAHNAQLLDRITESIMLVSKKGKNKQ